MRRKPIILVTSTLDNGNTFLQKDYTDSILLAGGIPLVVPNMSGNELFDSLVNAADGLLLSGGEDVDPNLYGEEPKPGLGALTPERDQVEKQLTLRFLAVDKPIFAICRGLQLLNAVAGGTLVQDIERHYEAPLQHRQLAPRNHLSHRVDIQAGSQLEKAAGFTQIRVNSFHHQAIKQIAPGFRLNAAAADGIVEGIESISHRYVIGVQWHPENMARTDSAALNLFTSFIQACCGGTGTDAI